MDVTKLDIISIVQDLNKNVFSNKIPPIKFIWKKNMTSSAGTFIVRTNSSGQKFASVSLSSVVLKTEAQVWETIAHELCHLAVVFIDGGGSSHGPQFRSWSSKVNQVYPSVKISIRHEYKTNFTVPPTYQCKECQKVHVRQRKLNVLKFRCKCQGVLVRI
ncbi:SprT [Helicoverpa armigera granulovirus]|uniref:SprT n=1 Tax=Helicoverpa armigera granulovirus TaxID=489830 RepID=A9YML3_9BBAC|nr:SprT [Helicoverpa armigera granulovirus]ABY47712.1 SprT [Helicoverpa armigera granulovirus]